MLAFLWLSNESVSSRSSHGWHVVPPSARPAVRLTEHALHSDGVRHHDKSWRTMCEFFLSPVAGSVRLASQNATLTFTQLRLAVAGRAHHVGCTGLALVSGNTLRNAAREQCSPVREFLQSAETRLMEWIGALLDLSGCRHVAQFLRGHLYTYTYWAVTDV